MGTWKVMENVDRTAKRDAEDNKCPQVWMPYLYVFLSSHKHHQTWGQF